MRAWDAAKTTFLVFTECPLCARHWSRLWFVAVNKTMGPALVVLAFRMGWGKTRQISKICEWHNKQKVLWTKIK